MSHTIEIFIIQVDCIWQEWSSATLLNCTRSCGGGFQNLTRTIVTNSAHGGVECNVVKCTNMTENCQTLTKDCNTNVECQGIWDRFLCSLE